MANVRFLDQVSVGVFQSTTGGSGTGDVSVQNGSFTYEPGYLVYSSGSNIVQSTNLIYVNDTTQTIIISGQLSSSGGITGSFFGTSSYAITASYALNAGAGAGFPYSGSAVITGSLLVTEGITGSLQGTSSFAVTASYVNNLGSSNYTQSFTNQSTWTVIHNLGARYVLVQTYDSNFDEMIPQNIDLTDNNTATITFPTLESGVAVVTVGGALQNASPQSSSYALTSVSSSFSSTSSYINPLTSQILNIGPVQETLVLATSTTTPSMSFDFNSGSVFYLTNQTSSTIWNITNVPTISPKSTTFTFTIEQGSQAYSGSTYQINGSSVSIKWSGGNVPTGSANKTDVIGLVAFRSGSVWNVLGSLSTFG